MSIINMFNSLLTNYNLNNDSKSVIMSKKPNLFLQYEYPQNIWMLQIIK